MEDLISGVSEQYAHVVVDEAQDLSPMQLRSVSRRSATGSMTIVGDIAQSTGPWARDDWDDVLAHLPSDLPQAIETLKYGYRVPRQIFEVAAPLLAVAAPTVEAPTIVRDGPSKPSFESVSDANRARAAVGAAMGHAAKGRSVGIICPGRCREAVEAELRDQDIQWFAAGGDLGRGINLISPQEAKGLEFDAVVLIEPEYILDEDDKGHRLLYVALTRPTRYLHIVAAGAHVPLPAAPTGSPALEALDPPQSVMASPDPRPQAEGSTAISPMAAQRRPSDSVEEPSTYRLPAQTAIDAFAVDLADQLRSGLAPNLWPAVLDRMRRLLNVD
ncbi:ATP-binding domain-containing protein [Actinomycetes bacterium KLBMP 9797]